MPRLLAYLHARYGDRLRSFDPWHAFDFLAGDSLSATARIMALLQTLPERDGAAADRDAMVNCGVLSQRLAESWFKKAAAAGDTGALANLAYLLRGLRPDDSRQWAQRAVDSSDPELDDTLDILFPDAEPKTS